MAMLGLQGSRQTSLECGIKRREWRSLLNVGLLRLSRRVDPNEFTTSARSVV